METSTSYYVVPKKSLAYMALIPASRDIEDMENLEKAEKERIERAAQVCQEDSGETITEKDVAQQQTADSSATETDLDMNTAPNLIELEADESSSKSQPDIEMTNSASFDDAQSHEDSTRVTGHQEVDNKEDSESISAKRNRVTSVEENDRKRQVTSDDNLKENITPPPPVPPRPENNNSKQEETSYEYPQSAKVETALSEGGQQDVTECIDNVLFQIEAGFKTKNTETDGEQLDIVKQLFYGKSKQVLENANDGSDRREQVNRFNCLIVHTAGSGSKNVYEALDSNFGESMIESGSGNNVVPTRRTETITQFPEMLQIHIQRVDFDRERLTVFKNTAFIKFDEVIYMDRYQDTQDPILIAKRREVLIWKLERQELQDRLKHLNKTQSNGLTVKGALTSTRDWLLAMKNQRSDDQLAVSEDTLNSLEEQIEKLTKELDDTQARLEELETKIQNQYKDMKQHPYRIHAVFIHRGTATQGHYWVYINDFKKGCFRKYNDEIVSEVPYSEVFSSDDSSSAATPYYVTYVRDDLADKYIQPVVEAHEASDPEVVQVENDDDHDMVGGDIKSKSYHDKVASSVADVSEEMLIDD